MMTLMKTSAALVMLLSTASALGSSLPRHVEALIEQKVKDPVSHGGYFGTAVAVNAANTLALVGAPADPYGSSCGWVVAYTKSNGVWVQSQTIQSPDPTVDGEFGFSIAISGSTAIIGAPTYGTLFNGGSPDIGKAYIYTYANGVWTLAADLMASDYDSYEFFGTSVAIDGTTAIIGAKEYASVHHKLGAAYIFAGTPAGLWHQSQKITSQTDNTPNGQFGYSVAISGNAAAVGQMTSSSGDSAIYFLSQSGGIWSQSQEIVPPQGGEPASSLAMTSSVAVAGAPAYTISGRTLQGAAYVFLNQSGLWSLNQTLTAPSGGTAQEQFGGSVAIQGSQILVGASHSVIGGNANQGAAYFFTQVSGQFGTGVRIIASDGAANDFFGSSVALSTTSPPTYLVGALGVHVQGVAYGAAYFYSPSP